MLTLLAIVPGLLLLCYVAAPVITRMTFKQRIYSTTHIVTQELIPAEALVWFSAMSPKLERQGFRFLGYFASDQVAHVRSYVAAFENRDRGQSAGITAILSEYLKPKLYLEFETIAVDPLCVVSTINVQGDVGVFDGLSWRHVTYFPWVTSVEDLYRIHLSREQQIIMPSCTRYLCPQQKLDSAGDAASVFLMRQQVGGGLLYETDEVGTFRATWHGAIIMTYRLLPPWKWVRMRANRRRAMRDADDALSRAIDPPRNVSLTNESPFEPPLSVDRLSYAR